jgi:hypothetical protein
MVKNPHDLSDEILARLSNFAVGLVKREGGKGSSVLGSGTLAAIEGRRGILTCGHVAELYEKLPEIGLIRFVDGNSQRRMIQLGDTQTIIIQSSDSFGERKEVLDLAFTMLPPETASSVEANGVFLNIERNRMKMEAYASTKSHFRDVMLGLVDEFSGEPFVQGKEIVSPMRGVLHSGGITSQENGLLTFKAMDYNLPHLPRSFGGMSGGGVWRAYFEEDARGSRVAEVMLCGVASWQIDGTTLACQGWDRIDQVLVGKVRKNLTFGQR